MLKILKKAFIVSLISMLGFYTSSAFAAWSSELKVQQIQMTPTGYIYIKLSGAIGFPGCTDASYLRYQNNETIVPNLDQIYSLLLLAMGQQLDILVHHGTTGVCANDVYVDNPYIAVR